MRVDGITSSMDMNLVKFQETVRDKEAWNAAVHEVAKSPTRLSDLTATTAILNGEGLDVFLLRSRKDNDIFRHHFFFLCLYIYLFGAALGLRCCASFSVAVASRDHSGCGARASHCTGVSSCGARALGSACFRSRGIRAQWFGSSAREHRLASCGTEAWLLHSVWDLPGSVSCFGGGFSTTEPPGKCPH